jgi:hypothetical protein
MVSVTGDFQRTNFMKLKTILITALFMLMFTSEIMAQDTRRAAETADTLRLQLLGVQAKEEELSVRLLQLEEDLKPGNIESALAGIGSTKPEDLREHRRRLLTIEKDNVMQQLKILLATRSRLESSLAFAEAQAYLQSARPSPTSPNQMLMAPALRVTTGGYIDLGFCQDLNDQRADDGRLEKAKVDAANCESARSPN